MEYRIRTVKPNTDPMEYDAGTIQRLLTEVFDSTIYPPRRIADMHLAIAQHMNLPSGMFMQTSFQLWGSKPNLNSGAPVPPDWIYSKESFYKITNITMSSEYNQEYDCEKIEKIIKFFINRHRCKKFIPSYFPLDRWSGADRPEYQQFMDELIWELIYQKEKNNDSNS